MILKKSTSLIFLLSSIALPIYSMDRIVQLCKDIPLDLEKIEEAANNISDNDIPLVLTVKEICLCLTKTARDHKNRNVELYNHNEEVCHDRQKIIGYYKKISDQKQELLDYALMLANIIKSNKEEYQKVLKEKEEIKIDHLKDVVCDIVDKEIKQHLKKENDKILLEHEKYKTMLDVNKFLVQEIELIKKEKEELQKKNEALLQENKEIKEKNEKLDLINSTVYRVMYKN